jgi:hypothetical protein
MYLRDFRHSDEATGMLMCVLASNDIAAAYGACPAAARRAPA